MLINPSTYLFNIPLSGVAVVPILIALKEWDRKSELSADRAAVLVSQDPMIDYSLLMKMSGGADFSQMNLNEFFLQAEEYNNMSGLADNVHKLINLMMINHPFPVLRLTELKTWVDGGGYHTILSKDYIERGIDEHQFENLKSAASQYRKDIEDSKGPIAGVTSAIFGAVDNVTDQASEMKGKVSDVWESLFGK